MQVTAVVIKALSVVLQYGMLFFLLFVVACEEVVAGDCVEGFVSFF